MPFGWNYPAGAEHDPNAPWNQPEAVPICPACHHTDETLDEGETCPDCGEGTIEYGHPEPDYPEDW